mgnify:CR=1 FL=1
MLMSFVGITVAGLFRIFTGFPIIRNAANQNVCKIKKFLHTLQIFLLSAELSIPKSKERGNTAGKKAGKKAEKERRAGKEGD